MKGRRLKRKGFVLLEVLLALGILAGAVTAFTLAMYQVAQLSDYGRREGEIQRILDSALTDAAMLPILEPIVYDYQLEEMDGIEMQVVVETIEDLESQEGQVVTGLLRVQVIARFNVDGEPVERTAETWRYSRLYQ